jgi:hypothetical protein
LFLLLLELCGLLLLVLLLCLPAANEPQEVSFEKLTAGTVSEYFLLMRAAILFLWVSIFALFLMLWAFCFSIEL